MARIKLIVAYDGTNYVGWQYQPNGISVQQRLEQALHQLTGIVHTVYSSGRTDSGVHARGMVCHLTTERDLPLSAWREGLNRFLPDDIAVRHAEDVDDQFHARFSARGKHYRYTILRDSIRSPLDCKTSWQVKKPLDLEKMQQVSQNFIGQHDFAAFRTSGCSADTTVREIFSIAFSEDGSLLHIDVCGSGFLRNMIRMMVGTLVQIGRGKRPENTIQKLLEGTEPVPSPLTAPAQGLCLMEVWF
ncbi:MAG: tRNA pseudouridine(38-40) synthase TruA [Desulfuromusa sp.]|jgi:tRNA pseudouridine38-40 synthase|nr:tRNA pseudouridine(38-40) synthase TruA [Desulfuromusa sp.]